MWRLVELFLPSGIVSPSATQMKLHDRRVGDYPDPRIFIFQRQEFRVVGRGVFDECGFVFNMGVGVAVAQFLGAKRVERFRVASELSCTKCVEMRWFLTAASDQPSKDSTAALTVAVAAARVSCLGITLGEVPATMREECHRHCGSAEGSKQRTLTYKSELRRNEPANDEDPSKRQPRGFVLAPGTAASALQPVMIE